MSTLYERIAAALSGLTDPKEIDDALRGYSNRDVISVVAADVESGGGGGSPPDALDELLISVGTGPSQPTFDEVLALNPTLLAEGWTAEFDYAASLGSTDGVQYVHPEGEDHVFVAEVQEGNATDVSEPDWSSAPNVGDTVGDGGYTWMNAGLFSAFPPTPTTWEAETEYTIPAMVWPTTPNGHLYVMFPTIVTMTSAPLEPPFDTIHYGQYVSDNDGYWMDAGRAQTAPFSAVWAPILDTLRGDQGNIGAQGPPGPAGSNGSNGTNGATWRTGTGPPSNGLGVNGDLYFDTDTDDVYLRAAGSYSIIANLRGVGLEDGVIWGCTVLPDGGTTGTPAFQVQAGVVRVKGVQSDATTPAQNAPGAQLGKVGLTLLSDNTDPVYVHFYAAQTAGTFDSAAVRGTPAPSPVIPAIPEGISLAVVLVPAGADNGSDCTFTDTREYVPTSRADTPSLLFSPDGSRWLPTAADDGTFSLTEVTT